MWEVREQIAENIKQYSIFSIFLCNILNLSSKCVHRQL